MLIYFETYGCALNRADTALMKSIVVEKGYEITNYAEKADVIIVNTCTVRLDTELRVLRRLSELHRKYGCSKKIVVSGCMATAQPYTVKKVAPRAILVSPQNVTKLVEAIEGGSDLILGVRDTSYLKPYVDGAIAAVPIAEGCIGDCSFCITKLARRRLRSYSLKDIVRVVKEAVSRGAIEVELTAQDTGSYGLDLGHVNLPDLVREIVDSVQGDYMLRIGMANPDTLARVLDGVVEVLKEQRVYKYLHIPLQSADDRVLKIMRRRYTYDEFREIVAELRRKIPGVAIATDIIVGHPGEDEEAFRRTIEAVVELQFDKVHVAQYTIRPRTESAAMPQVPENVKKRRSTILSRVVEEICLSINREYVGSLASVVLTHRSIRGDTTGRTINYKPVVILGGGVNVALGTKHLVHLSTATFYDLRGYVL
ncbi:MAG: tRNA (N(6)-L-threonylcarbamoyladenosine(37)-C(2))-methylthiotransferase [Sulfolobales archaeon]|nr:tRNA (N(6)-L-threonylcarbamoyladenosine(37)-C(2))-methylthiotransferase [Sulfolobales archaeon]MDW8082212.1 tRNA (N(6)-L-threonylcarbamoyladenosine(37)-C(2))-methylthiotransferase [Sulfolobales archaeon]